MLLVVMTVALSLFILRERKHFPRSFGNAGAKPVRGLILDRRGNELARDIEAKSIWADPREIENVEDISAQFAPLVGTDADVLADRLRNAQRRKFAWIARKLGLGQANRVLALNLRGIYSLKEPKRQYPNGQLAAHVLGFVGIDNVGLSGIEKSLNERLSGEADKSGTKGLDQPRGIFNAQARQGETVILTIDKSIQYEAEQILNSAVQRTHARSGSVVVLEPYTGEVFALANAPSFDPNDLRTASQSVHINQALQLIYEPGLPFKVVPYSAAIERGLAKPTDEFDCQMGSITVAGRFVHDHHPFGTLTLTDSFAKSSNVGAIKVGMRLGDGLLFDFTSHFGFGRKTGIELPGETAGLVRNVSSWQPSSVGSIAIGQEVGVAPMQMVSAYGTFANDGIWVAPHLVREMRESNGAIIYSALPEKHRVLRAETAQALRDMLKEGALKRD
jgi:cell division protein FtsI (penicillin-binding protein 3)